MAGTRPEKDNAWGTEPDEVILPSQPYRLDFVLAPSARIACRLLDSKGQPLPDFRVALTGRELPPSCSAIGSWTSDADGRFVTGDLPCRAFWFYIRQGRDDTKSEPFRLTAPGEYAMTLVYDPEQSRSLTCTIDSTPSSTNREEMIALATTKPDLEETLAAKVLQLGYVDETEEGKKSLAASGHAVRMECPEEGYFVEAAQIFASRYGHPQPPEEDFHLYLLNENHQVLADVPYPYSTIERGDMRWYTLRTPSVEVTKTFYVALAFNPHQTKGVYLGLDKSVDESHSFVGLPDSEYSPVDGKFDWMVRAYVADDPSGEKGTHRLADWSPPVYTDPFEGYLEVRYDDGESDGMQSYGGRGPAVRFDLSDSLKGVDDTKPLTLKGLRVYGSRYGSGYDPDTTTITVSVLDGADRMVGTAHMPYSLFSYNAEWVDLALDDPIALPAPDSGDARGLLTIAVDPHAHRTKGIYFHYNQDPAQTHSLAGTVEKGFEELPDREWMVRAFFGLGV